MLFVAVFDWGVAGAAIATDISQAISFVAAYYYMRRKYPVFRFALKEYKWNNALISRTVKIGFPISLQLIVVSFGLTFLQRAVNGFGQVMTASFTVGQRIEMYINLPLNALQTTLATYTGQNVGAGKIDRVKKGTRQTVIISLLMTMVISALVWALAPEIISLFGLSDRAAEYCLEGHCTHKHCTCRICSDLRSFPGKRTQYLPDDRCVWSAGDARACDLPLQVQYISRSYGYMVERDIRFLARFPYYVDILPERQMDKGQCQRTGDSILSMKAVL